MCPLYVESFRDDIVSQQDMEATISVQESALEYAKHRHEVFVDKEFPSDAKKKATAVSIKDLKCHCGTPAKKSVSKGHNEGKEYYHCSGRRCRFFQWLVKFDHTDLMWVRFPPPTYVFVADTGFRADDLQQGSVGDCWFLSALSCVAERPDLIMRLFPTHVANEQGIYQVCLFLDGVWRGFCVDDRLPINRGSLCYSQARNMQLWVPILEKAYAKAHGSYSSISGGHIAEAFTDLTGCPTKTYNFDHRDFRPRDFWSELVTFHRDNVPMGCATTGVRGLQKVGLVPNHAYSILDLKEFPKKHPSWHSKNVSGFTDDTLRLVRIRNPHGRGEWTGAWNDGDVQWRNLDLGLTTNINDGTFWMAYEDFLMGFQIVDVCLAYTNMHARSYQCEFPQKLDSVRSCQSFAVTALEPTTLYVMVCQPTKRGSWCRADRKVSYKPADVGIVAQYLDSAKVVGKMFGVERTAHIRLDLQAETVTVTPIVLGFPSASDGTFVVRLVSSHPVKVEKQPPVTAMNFARLMQDFCLTATRFVVCQSETNRIVVYRDRSAAFVMAFTRETTGIRLLVKARGMGCRTAQGLVAHTTVDGPKIKYRSVWRHFLIETTAMPGSQIVATLFQSACVDWQLGSIEGSFSVADKIVEPRGLFLPDDDERRWQENNVQDGKQSTFTGAGVQLDSDDDLEAAMVVSLDQEFNSALEKALQLSRKPADHMLNEDEALQAALTASRKQHLEAQTDLEVALAASRRDFRQCMHAPIEIDTDDESATSSLPLVDLTASDRVEGSPVYSMPIHSLNQVALEQNSALSITVGDLSDAEPVEIEQPAGGNSPESKRTKLF